MTRTVKILVGLTVVILCALAGVSGTRALLSEQEGDDSEGGPNATLVGLTSPEERRIESALTATGTIRAIRQVELVPDAPGRVTGVPVSSGQEVEEGDLLVQMDDRAARAALADAEATRQETQKSFDRVQRLADSDAAAESRLDEARANMLRAEAAEMSARADLEDLSIKAPFAGTVGVIDIETGAYLDGTEPLTRLSDLSSVEVSASLPERYFDTVTPDLALEVTTPAYPEESFEGAVTLRAPEIDRDTRNFEIRAEIDNPDRRLAGGMFARVRVWLDSYDGLAIPDAALISEGRDTYVYTVSDGTATRTDVEAGQSLGDLTEIREGMSKDDQVVVAGWDQLSDGAAVEVSGDDTSEQSE